MDQKTAFVHKKTVEGSVDIHLSLERWEWTMDTVLSSEISSNCAVCTISVSKKD